MYKSLSQLVNDKKKKRKSSKSIVFSNNTLLTESFIEAVEKYGITDRGDPLDLYNWHYEFLGLLGNLDITEVLTTGASQIGKTLFNTLLAVYLADLGYNVLWSFDTDTNLNKLVPVKFKPIANNWLANRLIQLPSDKVSNNSLYEFLKGSVSFRYISTTKVTNSTKGAAAGSAVTSITSDILFTEERSQYPIGSADPLYRRLDASRIPSHPVRPLGTPGNGNGIEMDIEHSQYYFYPHCICSECNQEIELTPKGSLLKPYTYEVAGKTKTKYLTESGKPKEWFCKDIDNAEETAYFACPYCHGEIPEDVRVRQSYFKCLKTGIKLSDFLLTDINISKKVSCGVNLSPLLRESQLNLASDIIQSGLSSNNTDDWCQQRLGLPSTTSNTSITLDMLKPCIGAEIPNREPDYIIAGIDPGAYGYWLIIIAYYLPLPNEDVYLKTYQKQDKTIRRVLYGERCNVNDIPQKLIDYKVDYGIVDNEPYIGDVSRLCDRTCLEMADQREMPLVDHEKSFVYSGGVKYPCYKLNNQIYLRSVLNGFITMADDGLPLIRFPESWCRWLNNNSEMSPLRHYQSLRYSIAKERFVRTNKVDHLYYATMFAELGFSIKISKPMGLWGNMK